MSSQVNNAFNNYATNVAQNSSQSKALADTFSKLLLGKPFAQLTSSEQDKVKMAVASAQQTFGNVLSGENPMEDYSTIYQSIASVGTGLAISGAKEGRIYGQSPEAMVAAGGVYKTMDRYLHGNSNIWSTGSGSGVSTTTASGYIGQVMRARGGVMQGELERYNLDGTSYSQREEQIEKMAQESTMSEAEIQKIRADNLMTNELDRLAKKDGRFADFASADAEHQQQFISQLKEKVSGMSDKEKERYQKEIKDNIRKEKEEELTAKYKNKDGTWKQGWDADKVAVQADTELKGIRDIDLTSSMTEEGVMQAARTAGGKSSYDAITKDFKKNIESALKSAEATLADMTEIFGTDNFDELMQQANQFGVTTLASEQGVKKMQRVMDAARARAAATGRTVQEVMVEYGKVAASGGQLFGGAQNMHTGYLKQYNMMQASAEQNVASGFDTRTEEERMAAFNAQQANDAHYHREAVWALETGAEAGDERMTELLERVKSSASGGQPLSDAEYSQILEEAKAWARTNGSHMTERAYNDHYANSSLAGVFNQAANVKRRTDFGKQNAEEITRHWMDNDTSLAYKQVLSDQEGKNLGNSVAERREVMQSTMENAIFEFGNNNAAMKTFLDEGGEMDEGIKRHGGDVDAYIKEYTDQMRKEGRSEESIQRMTSMISNVNKMSAEQRKHLQDGIEGAQRDDRIGAGDAQIFALNRREQEAERNRAIDATRGGAAKANSGDLGAFLRKGPSSAETDMTAALYQLGSEAGKDAMLVGADGEVLAENINATAHMSDEELKKLGHSAESIDRLRKISGNTYALKADENKQFNWEQVKSDSAKNIETINALQAEIEKAETPEEKAALERQLKAVQGQQTQLESIVGMDAKAIAERENMSSEELTNRVYDNMSEQGKKFAADKSGNVAVIGDTAVQNEVTEELRQGALFDLVTHMVGLDGLSNEDLKRAQQDKKNLTKEQRADIINKGSKDGVLQRILQMAEENGEIITTSEKDGHTQVNLGSKEITTDEQRNNLLLGAAIQKEGGAKAIMEAAKNGSKTDLELWNQSVENSIAYTAKDGGVGFSYRAAGKALGLEDEQMTQVRKLEDQLDEKIKRFQEVREKGGTVSASELDEMQRITKALDDFTQGLRTKGKDDTVSIDGKTVQISQLEDQAEDRDEAKSAMASIQQDAEKKNADLMAAAQKEKEAKAKEQQEQSEFRTKGLSLIKKLLNIKLSDDGSVNVDVV